MLNQLLCLYTVSIIDKCQSPLDACGPVRRRGRRYPLKLMMAIAALMEDETENSS
jgi:hypothetical protein